MAITVTITKEFIEYRNEYSAKFQDFGRTELEKLIHADALIVEWYLLSIGRVSPPTSIKHDFITKAGKKVDNKMISQDAGSVTVRDSKIDWMRQACVEGELDEFSVTQWVKRPDGRALQEGDVVEFKFISVLPAREALSKTNLRKSKYYSDCHYFWA